ncbi:hypothetical protein K1719_031184 [Acacia pycnantha]|nr:hypothetical protein K1719_031184 [Acacia pycnantha]
MLSEACLESRKIFLVLWNLKNVQRQLNSIRIQVASIIFFRLHVARQSPEISSIEVIYISCSVNRFLQPAFTVQTSEIYHQVHLSVVYR